MDGWFDIHATCDSNVFVSISLFVVVNDLLLYKVNYIYRTISLE